MCLELNPCWETAGGKTRQRALQGWRVCSDQSGPAFELKLRGWAALPGEVPEWGREEGTQSGGNGVGGMSNHPAKPAPPDSSIVGTDSGVLVMF